MAGAQNDRNALTLLDRVKMTLILLPAPTVLTWALIWAPFSSYGRAKSWKRNLADRLIRMTVTGMSRRQARALFGTTRGTYDKFVMDKKLPPVIEELGEDARLLSLGNKRTERVLLYLHGGAFLFGVPNFAVAFWKYIQDNLEQRGKPTGVTILNYTLVPDAAFPTQLKQSVLAIQHLLDAGVKPQNIQIAGDSAGAALIHEVWSHMLHPVDGVPQLDMSSPFGGAYLMSPWARLVDKEGCLCTNGGNYDFLTAKTIDYWGHKVLDGLPQSAIPYIEPNSAPMDWLDGLDKCVKRILISAGGVEILRHEIVKFEETVKRHHEDVTLIIQENGTHNDAYTDFLTGEKDLGELTPFVLDWLDGGFSKTS